MDTIGQRLDTLRAHFGLSYERLASIIGDITGDALRKAVKRNSVKEYYLRILSDKLGISQTWLITGEGEMLRTLKDPSKSHDMARSAISSIIHVSAPGQLEFCSGNRDPSVNQDLFSYHIPGFRSEGFSFPILGAGMEPALHPGEIVITDRENVKSIEEINFHSAYAVAYLNKVNVRMIEKHEDPGMINLKPLNDNFNMYAVDFDSVELFKTRRVIRWRIQIM